ncbi:MAG: InlB B-repeat-containing protein [Clostridia bacterium]|nr:InlB B-repeat-containing protein [Clostridia bacterium]
MKRKSIFFAGVLALIIATCAACSDKGDNNDSGQYSEDSSRSEISSSVTDTPSSDDLETSSKEENSSGEAPSEEDVVQEYTVTFDTDGGNTINAVTVKKGEKLERPEDPQKSSSEFEYEFLGWYYGDVAWDFENNVVTEDVTLVAKWKKLDSYTKPFLPKD